MSETITAFEPTRMIDPGSSAVSVQLDALHASGPAERIDNEPMPPGTAEDE